MNFLDGLTVLVLGLGDSGLAMARWCARCGVRELRVWDSREPAPQAAALREALPSALILGGALDAEVALEGVQLLLKSPGLAPHDERIAPLLAAARARGIAVLAELDLFTRALNELKAERGYAPQLLAITGTNGKTTTTAMTALLVARAGRRVAMAGNIGPSMLATLGQALDEQAASAAGPHPGPLPAGEGVDHAQLPEVWVLELSSFQLDDVRDFEPSAAALLNITQDHLDWHGSMAAYAEAKARIFGRDAVMVVNRDDAQIEALVEALLAPPPMAKPGKAPAKGRKPTPRRIVRFGLDLPRRAGDFGLAVENGMAWLVRAQAADDAPRKRRDEPGAEELHLQRLMPADALRLRGRHNAANALAALALASAIGCPLAPMLHGLREYRGEPHRVEHVASVHGIDFFDDSKGTNVGASVAAIDGLGADRAPARLVLLLGGDGKGQDFTPLAAPLARHARAVATLGRDAAQIEAVLGETEVPLERHATLQAATRWAFAQARPGDAVLLSPACASLDMFRNYGHRAEVFVAEVRAIALEQGELA
jgi:UDP-N-acetylmuramoylalanine--D-glutamate ligase